MKKITHESFTAGAALTAVLLGASACNGLSISHNDSPRAISTPATEVTPVTAVTLSPTPETEPVVTVSPTPEYTPSSTPSATTEATDDSLPGLVRDGCGIVTIDTGYAGPDLRSALQAIGYDPTKMNGVRDTANEATERLEGMHHKYQFLIPGDTFGVCIDGNDVQLDASHLSVIDK